MDFIVTRTTSNVFVLESRSIGDFATINIGSDKEDYKTEMDDVFDNIMEEIAANDTDDAEQSFNDFIEKVSEYRRIVLARRTSNDHNRTITQPIQNARTARRRSEGRRREDNGGKTNVVKLIISVFLDLWDSIQGSE
ncbi:hypothetical protein O3G_MSEX005546 [Manduca sexta]|uniref:Uncharacterized protein n=1 Tax=Manduca sexta TaxID=7130 RepID=A0A921YZZ4_MANSE|nr:hypothetical protein O3G_MSEX005546 [Manduca sexta]